MREDKTKRREAKLEATRRNILQATLTTTINAMEVSNGRTPFWDNICFCDPLNIYYCCNNANKEEEEVAPWKIHVDILGHCKPD